MNDRPRVRRVAYVVAVLAPAASLLVRWPLWPVLGDAVPHMTFFPAVMIAAYIGGFWPGLMATLVSAVTANYYLTEQLPSFHARSVNDVVALSLFVLVGTIIIGLCEFLHRARHRIQADERRRAEEAVRASEERFRDLILALPAAVYTTDREGRITLFNDQAVQLWGRRPEVGQDMWCGSWRIFEPDGTLVPHPQCTMAGALREGRRVQGQEVV